LGRIRRPISCSLRSMERQAISLSWPLGLFRSHRLHISLEMRVRFQEGFSSINRLIQSISVRSNRRPCMAISSFMDGKIQENHCGVQIERGPVGDTSKVRQNGFAPHHRSLRSNLYLTLFISVFPRRETFLKEPKESAESVLYSTHLFLHHCE